MLADTRKQELQENIRRTIYPTRPDLQAELKHYHTLIRTAEKAVRLNQQIAIAHALNTNADKKLLDDLIEERNKIAERLVNES